MTAKHAKSNGSTKGAPQVRGITLEWETHCEIKKIAEVTGMKMADIYRLAISRLIDEVKETGRLPLPTIAIMPVAESETEGGEA